MHPLQNEKDVKTRLSEDNRVFRRVGSIFFDPRPMLDASDRGFSQISGSSVR